MILSNLSLLNFRQFTELSVEFHPEFNLIIGENGKGKTSVLNAISVVLGGWIFAYKTINNNVYLRNFESKDIHIHYSDGRFEKETRITATAEFSTSVINAKEGFTLEESEIVLTRTAEQSMKHGLSVKQKKSGEKSYSGLSMRGQGETIHEFIKNGRSFNLPLIIEYPCERLWHDTSKKIDATDLINKPYSPSRFDIYENWFGAKVSNEDEITEWIVRQELKSLQAGNKTSEYKIIQTAARHALDNCTSIRFDMDLSRIIIELEDRSTFFEHLSDGQRILLGLFLDIAHRMCILNPQLKENALEHTPGIVLIDELDLHLHPKWQRSVMVNLRRAFPKIQFICTTHSPQLIGQAKPAEIILLGNDAAHPDHSFGMDSNWILKYIMGSDAQDAGTAKKLDSLFEFINNDDLNSAKSLLAELREELNDHPDLVEAEALIHRNELFDDKD